MRRLEAPIACAFYLLPTSLLAAQKEAHRGELPDSIYGFHLVESTAFEGDTGTVFRFTNSEGVRADVFIYLVPASRSASADSAKLSEEVRTFIAGLAAGPHRGWYDAYRVPIDTALSIDTDAGNIPGRVVIMVFRRRGEAFVSFMHLFLRERHYVKVRLTLPAQEWETSGAPDFAIQLAKALFR